MGGFTWNVLLHETVHFNVKQSYAVYSFSFLFVVVQLSEPAVGVSSSHRGEGRGGRWRSDWSSSVPVRGLVWPSRRRAWRFLRRHYQFRTQASIWQVVVAVLSGAWLSGVRAAVTHEPRWPAARRGEITVSVVFTACCLSEDWFHGLSVQGNNFGLRQKVQKQNNWSTTVISFINRSVWLRPTKINRAQTINSSDGGAAQCWILLRHRTHSKVFTKVTLLHYCNRFLLVFSTSMKSGTSKSATGELYTIFFLYFNELLILNQLLINSWYQ